jgi:formylglycine-generating enzyme required for sulfatase activity
LAFLSLKPREVGGLVVSLRPAPQQVKITSDPPGAEVLEGGVILGVTPLQLPAISPGTSLVYQLKLDGYQSAEVAGEILVGKPLELVAALRAVSLGSFQGTRAGEERDFEIAPGVVMTFCWCPPGKFIMGSPEDELGREPDEEQVEVTLSKGFWLAKTEVTQEQWKAAGGADVGDLPPAFWEGEVRYTWEQMRDQGIHPANFRGVNLPVERVEWTNARDWCLGLAERLRDDGQLGVGWEVVLPTEAQWEYACRAGVSTAFNHGRNLLSKVGSCRNLDEVGWYDQNSENGTQPVGMKKANAWGLHDMHGNVWEWCANWYGSKLEGGLDPRGAASGVYRAYRGGSWRNTAAYCRSAFRYRDMPDGRFINLGLRPALVLPE